jgi:hypothetical protein
MPQRKLPYSIDTLPTGLPVESILIEHLLLDPENPRLNLPPNPSQNKILLQLYEEHRLEELMQSLVSNGYFDEEPLVAVPSTHKGKYIVVEGNRRLAALKLLTDETLAAKLRVRGVPEATQAQISRILAVPVKVYSKREDVLPYLGFRHITGVKEWDAASKAKYIYQLRHDSGMELSEIGERIGDTYNTTERLYLGWSLLNQAETSLGISQDDFFKFHFSYMYDAVRMPEIKEFLGLESDRHTLAKKDLPKLGELVTWLFGSRSHRAAPVVEQKSQLKKLAYAVSDKKGTAALRSGLSLEDAYQETIGEREELISNLTKASRELDRAKAVVHRHKSDEEIGELVNRCRQTISSMARELAID